MTQPTLGELRTVWAGRAAGDAAGQPDERHRVALQLLASGEPVGADRIAAAAGEPVEQVRGWLERLRTRGFELDEHGRLIGAALTLRPTPHRFRVRGNDLYAWCGFDTLFLPILLGEPAEVASTCPVTGRPIALEVADDGTVVAARPATTVAAIVGASVVDSCSTTGPGSAICSQMPLFADREAGERWQRSHPGVAIVDLETAATIARSYAEQHGCC